MLDGPQYDSLLFADDGSDGSSVTRTHGVLPAIRPCMFAVRFILFGVVLAQLADAFTFTVGLSRFGIGLESNGIAAVLYQSADWAAYCLRKLRCSW